MTEMLQKCHCGAGFGKGWNKASAEGQEVAENGGEVPPGVS